MCTGAPEIRFSHSMCDAVREKYSPRGEGSCGLVHTLTPIGERNKLADLEAWRRQQGQEAAGPRVLAKAVGGGGH